MPTSPSPRFDLLFAGSSLLEETLLAALLRLHVRSSYRSRWLNSKHWAPAQIGALETPVAVGEACLVFFTCLLPLAMDLRPRQLGHMHLFYFPRLGEAVWH